MGDFASKGVAGAGLGTGIVGLSLGVLNSMGGLGLNYFLDDEDLTVLYDLIKRS